MLEATILQEPEGDPATTESPSSGSLLIPFAIIGAVFWLLIIGPERKNRKKREALLAGIAKGDEVMTTGGLMGKVAQVQEDVVTLQVADNVRLKFRREAIQTIVGDKQEEPAKAGA